MKKLEEGAGEWRSLGAGAVVAFAAFLEEIRASSSDASRIRAVSRSGAARTRAFLRLTFPLANCRLPPYSDYKLEYFKVGSRTFSRRPNFAAATLTSIADPIRGGIIFDGLIPSMIAFATFCVLRRVLRVSRRSIVEHSVIWSSQMHKRLGELNSVSKVAFDCAVA